MRINQGHSYRHTVPHDDDGCTLAEHLAKRFRHSDVAAWRERIAEGRVRIDDAVASPDRIVSAGERIVYEREPWHEREPPALTVLHEDDHVLVIDKPAGLQVLPAGSRLRETLLHAVRGDDPARAEWSPVHRLGRGTSGVQVFAKSALARASLARQWRYRTPGKLYLARVTGERLPTSLAVTMPIGKVSHSGGALHAASPDGKPSRTRVRVVRSEPGSGEALVAAWPYTGRPHQIRIHLAWSGAPIVGDPLFGPRGVLLDARPGDAGYLLHAASLRFRHPATGSSLKVRAPLPTWVLTRT